MTPAPVSDEVDERRLELTRSRTSVNVKLVAESVMVAVLATEGDGTSTPCVLAAPSEAGTGRDTALTKLSSSAPPGWPPGRCPERQRHRRLAGIGVDGALITTSDDVCCRMPVGASTRQDAVDDDIRRRAALAHVRAAAQRRRPGRHRRMTSDLR